MASTYPIRISTSIPDLFLRTPEATQHDAEGLSLMFNHKFNNRFEPERPNRKDPDAEHYRNTIPKWLERAEQGGNAFLIIVKVSAEDDKDEVIGFGGINGLEKRPDPQGKDEIKVANVGVMIHEPFTGKGYGSAAMYATIDAAFNTFNVDIVEAETMGVNTPFRGLMKKMKLDQFSTMRQADHGEEYVFWITKANWESVK